MKLSAPWINYYHEVETLFSGDDDIRVVYNDETKELKLYVGNPRKADALAKLLPEEKSFGNVKIVISVVPANKENESPLDLYREAFRDNYNVAFIDSLKTPFGVSNYVVFKPRIAQFFADDIGDYFGNISMLYEDLARKVFDKSDVNFCTDNINTRIVHRSTFNGNDFPERL